MTLYFDAVHSNTTTGGWSFVCSVLFVIADYAVRTVPLLLTLYNGIWSPFVTVFGLQITWCLEVVIWSRISHYFSWFPMRTMYPFTFLEFTVKHQKHERFLAIDPTVIDSIDVQSLRKEQYHHPMYVGGGSVDSPNDSLLEYDDRNRIGSIRNMRDRREERLSVRVCWLTAVEWKAMGWAVIGGTVSLWTGWLIGWSARHSISSTQYLYCVVEMCSRYMLSLVLVAVYWYQYESRILDGIDRTLIIVVGVCLVFLILYLPLVQRVYAP